MSSAPAPAFAPSPARPADQPPPLLVALTSSDLAAVDQAASDAAGRAAAEQRPLWAVVVVRPSPLSTHPVRHALAARERARHIEEAGAAARAAAARMGVDLTGLYELAAPRAWRRARRPHLLRRRLHALATRLGAELHPLHQAGHPACSVCPERPALHA
ncbi:MAG: hypothetical protein JOY78_14870 [Pseudonocardia sp.]|nr:hypothetical protein [Pseudonocardia sp.]